MENLSELSTESLEFNDVRLAFLSIFPLPVSESLTREQAIEALKEKGVKTEWGVPYSKDFEIAEEFLLPRTIIDQYFRLKLDDFELSFGRMIKGKPTDTKLSATVFLTVYPKVGVSILLFNIRSNKCDVDDLIFLQHSFYGRTKLAIISSRPFEQAQNKISLEEVAKRYIDLILSSFGITIQNPKILLSRCMEIRKSPNFRTRDPEELFQRFPRQAYGLLVADEGWRFVPPDTAEARMQLRWRTRDFLSVVAFADSIIFVNLREGETYKQYVASQEQIRTKYSHEVEKYFTYSPEIAGLNHGPLFILENACVQRFIVEQIAEQIVEMELRSIKEILSFREKLLDALTKLSYIKIPEIGLLEQNVREAMMISKGVEELKKKLGEVESTLLIRYNQRINRGIIILTVVSLAIGTLSILVEAGLLDRLLDIIG